MGGTWRIPVLMHLLDKDFVKDLKQDGTFNEAGFDREYKIRDLYSLNIVNCWKLLRVLTTYKSNNVKNWTISSQAYV